MGRRIAGWKRKLLLRANKEILIKVVAQATPTYTMSCFMVRNIWWGQKENERKMAWISWESCVKGSQKVEWALRISGPSI